MKLQEKLLGIDEVPFDSERYLKSRNPEASIYDPLRVIRWRYNKSRNMVRIPFLRLFLSLDSPKLMQELSNGQMGLVI